MAAARGLGVGAASGAGLGGVAAGGTSALDRIQRLERRVEALQEAASKGEVRGAVAHASLGSAASQPANVSTLDPLGLLRCLRGDGVTGQGHCTHCCPPEQGEVIELAGRMRELEPRMETHMSHLRADIKQVRRCCALLHSHGWNVAPFSEAPAHSTQRWWMRRVPLGSPQALSLSTSASKSALDSEVSARLRELEARVGLRLSSGSLRPRLL
jgi:hypothetical protein